MISDNINLLTRSLEKNANYVNNASHNIANSLTKDYTALPSSPQDKVNEVANPLTSSSPSASNSTYIANNDVSIVKEAVNLKQASLSYKIAAKVISSINETEEDVLKELVG